MVFCPAAAPPPLKCFRPSCGKLVHARLTPACTVPYSHQMSTMRKGAEEARNQLHDLLTAAERGQSTIITRHGHPVAALVPIEAYGMAVRQQPLIPVAGVWPRIVGKAKQPHPQQAACRMEPLAFQDLPQDALVLIGAAPTIYILEGHAKFARQFMPLFEAHAHAACASPSRPLRSPKYSPARCSQTMRPSRAVPGQSSNHGNLCRSTSILQKARRGCGPHSVSGWQMLFRRQALLPSTPLPW